ncbi:hypothetical protein DPMN_059671 [Dreissena polymorpha]|uniref:Uncharacterized protein n=1 Tax=Dreissena polymorpha TaxID=45954 RepID=A0A9D4C3X2_DREPO|nr:hypothetical protein DPMN_059671 [Dreissena polymorpha]
MTKGLHNYSGVTVCGSVNSGDINIAVRNGRQWLHDYSDARCGMVNSGYIKIEVRYGRQWLHSYNGAARSTSVTYIQWSGNVEAVQRGYKATVVREDRQRSTTVSMLHRFIFFSYSGIIITGYGKVNRAYIASEMPSRLQRSPCYSGRQRTKIKTYNVHGGCERILENTLEAVIKPGTVRSLGGYHIRNILDIPNSLSKVLIFK